MPGFLDLQDLSSNEIERAVTARRAACLPLIDLTCSNPTRHGFIFPPQVLCAESERYFSSRRYEPDSLGLPVAREAVAEYYGRRRPPLEISPEQVVITSSTSESYSLLFSLLCDAGDNLLAPDITYPLFDLLAAHQRIELKPYHICEGDTWEIDEDSIGRSVDGRTRGILLISPHNPTGMILKKPLACLSKLGLPLVCDEVFSEMYSLEGGVAPLGTLQPGQEVFHLNGASKMFALPDLKIGWIALNAPAWKRFGRRLEILNDVFLGASSLAQNLLPELFRSGQSFVQAMRRAVSERIDLALRLIEEGGALSAVRPEGGCALFARLKRELDEEALVLGLVSRGVFVHPGYFYGCQTGAHVMISCLLQEEPLSQGLRIVSSFSAELAADCRPG